MTDDHDEGRPVRCVGPAAFTHELEQALGSLRAGRVKSLSAVFEAMTGIGRVSVMTFDEPATAVVNDPAEDTQR